MPPRNEPGSSVNPVLENGYSLNIPPPAKVLEIHPTYTVSHTNSPYTSAKPNL